MLKLDERIERDQIERVRSVRAKRDAAAASAAVQALEDAARGGDNLMPQILHAVKQRVTLGEIGHGLRWVFGRHQEVLVV